MNEKPCEFYREWMSLAQDGVLNGRQSRLLHEHLSTCPACQLQWEAMVLVSQTFRAAPMIGPAPGFVARFQARLAHREEQRRWVMTVALLSTGVIALTILALPSLIDLLGFTGRLILPYWLVAYAQGVFNWVYLVLRALLDAARLLLINFVATPAGLTCVGSVAMAGVLVLICVPLMVGQMTRRTVK